VRNNAQTLREKPGRPKEFVGETADATGASRRAVQLAVARAQKVPEEIRDEIRGTALVIGFELRQPA